MRELCSYSQVFCSPATTPRVKQASRNPPVITHLLCNFCWLDVFFFRVKLVKKIMFLYPAFTHINYHVNIADPSSLSLIFASWLIMNSWICKLCLLKLTFTWITEGNICIRVCQAERSLKSPLPGETKVLSKTSPDNYHNNIMGDKLLLNFGAKFQP